MANDLSTGVILSEFIVWQPSHTEETEYRHQAAKPRTMH